MKQDWKHQFIAIEGNIGAGKTSLCTRLASDFNSRLVLEEFSDNPFLPLFYENPERYAFTVELFFMAERFKQLQGQLPEQQLFPESTIADYFFIKTLLFAQKNLNEEEFRLFQRFFKILNSNFPKPDLLVYLHRPIEALLGNIKRRGREYEADISENYLSNIQAAYFDFFKTASTVPILIIDIGETDFLNDEAVYAELVNAINQPYSVGVHQIIIR